MAYVTAFAGLLLLAASAALLLPAVVLLAQTVLASPRRTAPAAVPDGVRPRLAVLMPAHNESGGIAASIRSVMSQLEGVDRLVVVADNCDDDTAAVARALGAEVVERSDPLHRGKGYALDFGVRHLQAAPVDVVVIVDADCLVEPGSLKQLAGDVMRSGRPVQALYLMTAPKGAGVKTRIAEFAWIVRNHVRPSGFHRLGLPCQLMGTGMAFPWALIAGASLASGHIVEDMQLGLDLAAAGTPPMFCPSALVTSVFPEGDSATKVQRTRWEHGHLAMIGSRGLPLLWQSAIRGRLLPGAMALDLCVPPLASLVLMLIVAASCTAALALIGGSTVPFGVALLALSMTAIAVALAWSRFARHTVSFVEFLSVPAYVLRKIPIYIKLFTARQMEWVRTKRDDSSR